MNVDYRWLDDPRIFQVNRLPAHSDHEIYSGRRDAGKGYSNLVQSLSGNWQFRYLEHPPVPENFGTPEEDLTAYGTIAVPGHIELAGYHPIHYSNSDYPWEGKIFRRPAGSLGQSVEAAAGSFSQGVDNPVGLYRRNFFWEPQRKGDGAVLRFEGAEQALFVWVNGSFVGYGEDSFTPSEFDITPYIHAGENQLACALFRHSTASWLEDQDFFRFFGLFRDVKLVTRPCVHVEDLFLHPQVDPSLGRGHLDLTLKLRGISEMTDLRLVLKDPEGQERGSWNVPGESFRQEGELAVADFSTGDLGSVALWDEETPLLYTLEVEVLRGREICEVAVTRLGFRRLTVEEGVICLNGRRLRLCGVNRHEWSAERGRAITGEEMQQDMACLLRNHINAVRTCHYPDQLGWYRLCDANGIYVMAEVNLEAHGSWQKYGVGVERSWNVPGSLEPWREVCLDRARSNFETFKNHPSVLFWSLGNESCGGDVIRDMNTFFKKVDPDRLTHYESSFYTPEYRSTISDVESRMYASPETVSAYLEDHPDKPYILCEFMHDMGNSMGGLKSYTDLFDRYPMYTGGFIWDMIDQALFITDPTSGKQGLGYGGDFDDRLSENEFSGDGILFADRREKPAMQEVRELYGRYIRSRKAGLPECADRLPVGEGILWDMEEVSDVSELWEDSSASGASEKQPLKLIFGDSGLGVQGSRIRWIFSYAKGGPASLVKDETEWLYRAPSITTWRATTCNDRGCGFSLRSGQWLNADLFPLSQSIRVKRDGQEIPLPIAPENNRYTDQETAETLEILFTGKTNTIPAAEVETSYLVSGDGSCRVTVTYRGCQGLPELPVLGWRMIAPTAADRFCYQGLSGETYPDRMEGGKPGIYQVEGMPVTPYLVPQECGNHMNTSWVKIHRSTAWKNTCPQVDSTLTIRMDPEVLAFTCLPYTAEELENATHPQELPPVSRTVLTVRGCVRGVGGINSWGADVEPSCRISGEEDHSFTFVIE